MKRIGPAILLIFLSGLLPMRAQQSTQAESNPQAAATAPDDAGPLAVGKAALTRGDYASAKTFFTSYVSSTPNDAEAWFYLGAAELGLDQPADAVKALRKCIELRPDAWSAHTNLVLAYAEMQDWPAFDKERALIKAARDENKPGIALDGHDVIDVLNVNGQKYQVWYFYKPYGHFHARYVFLHRGQDGHADHWFQCESDDADQSLFQQKHPKEAKAGERSYSLDSYTVEKLGQNPSQALHGFYWDGEPTYETVRADVLKALAGETKPAATSTPPAK